VLKTRKYIALGIAIVIFLSGINTVLFTLNKPNEEENNILESYSIPRLIGNNTRLEIFTNATGTYTKSQDGSQVTRISSDNNNYYDFEPNFLIIEEDAILNTNPNDLELDLLFNEGTGTITVDSSPKERTVVLDNVWEGDEWSSSYNTDANWSLYFTAPETVYAVMDGQDFNDSAWSFGVWGKMNRSVYSGFSLIFSVIDWALYSDTLTFYHANATDRLYIKMEGSTSDGRWYVTAPANVSEWQFYVVTWSGNTSEIPKLYVNGTEATLTEDLTFSGDVDDIDRFYLGESTTMSGYGHMDNGFVYSTNLSQSTIAELYQLMPNKNVSLNIKVNEFTESSPYLYAENNSMFWYGNGMELNTSDVVNTSGLLAWYKMDENVVDADLIDSSGNGYTGTPIGSPVYVTSPNSSFGYALDFTPSDYVSIPDNDVFSFGDGSTDSPFSVDLWIQSDNINDNFQIISKYWGTRREWTLDCSSGTLQIGLWDHSAVDYIGAYKLSAMEQDILYHIVATYDGSASGNGISIYLNGSLVTGMTTHTGGSYVAMENLVEPVTIGRNAGSYHDGIIDNVRIWDYELNSTEAVDLYKNAPVDYIAYGTEDLTINCTVTYNGTSGLDVVNLTESWFNDSPEYNLTGVSFNNSYNILLNPSFELGDGIYDVYNWGPYTLRQNYPVTGAYGCRLSDTYNLSQTIDDWPVEMVSNISFWGRANTATLDFSFDVYINYTDSTSDSFSYLTSSTTYTQYTINKSDLSVDKAIRSINLYWNDTGGYIGYIDDVAIYLEPMVEISLDFDVSTLDTQTGTMYISVWTANPTTTNTTITVDRDITAPVYGNVTNTENSDYLYSTDLVGYWKLNEGTGSAISDSSGNGLNGTTINSPSWVSSFSTEANWSLDLEESSGQYINFGDHDDFSFVGDIPFSIDLWLTLESYDTDGVVIDKREYTLEHEDGDLEFTLTDTDVTSNRLNVLWGTGISEGSSWIHVAVTYDGSQDKSGLTAYINGANDTNYRGEAGTFTGLKNSDYPLYIGEAHIGTDFWDGKVDNLRLWNKELTDIEVANLYSADEFDQIDCVYFSDNMGASAQTFEINGTASDDGSGILVVNSTDIWGDSVTNSGTNESWSHDWTIDEDWTTFGQLQAVTNPDLELGDQDWSITQGGIYGYGPFDHWAHSGHYSMVLYGYGGDATQSINDVLVDDIELFYFWLNGEWYTPEINPIIMQLTVTYNDTTSTVMNFTYQGISYYEQMVIPLANLSSGKFVSQIRFDEMIGGSEALHLDDIFMYAPFDDISNSTTITVYDNVGNFANHTSYNFINDETAPASGSSFDPMLSYSATGDTGEVYVVTANDTFYFSNSFDSDVNIDFLANVSDSGSGIRGVDYGSFGTDDPTEDQVSPYYGNYTINDTDASASITIVATDNVGNNETEYIYAYEDMQSWIINITQELENSIYLYKEYGNLTQGYYGSEMGSTQQYNISGTAIFNQTYLSNVDFESALAGTWNVSGDEIRSTTADWEGTYGARITNGSSPNYDDGWIEQEGLWIYSDTVANITFMASDRDDCDVYVVVFYTDGSNTTQYFNSGWDVDVHFKRATGPLVAGKIINKIRLGSNYSTPSTDAVYVDYITFDIIDTGWNMADNTTFGNNPTFTTSTGVWNVTYEIDSADNGNTTVTIYTYDLVGNIGNNRTYIFYEDNTVPEVDIDPTETNESSEYLYYDANQTGYYNPEGMPSTPSIPTDYDAYLNLSLLFDEGTGVQTYDSSGESRTISETNWDSDEWNSSSHSTLADYCVEFNNENIIATWDGEDLDAHSWSIMGWYKFGTAVWTNTQEMWGFRDTSTSVYSFLLYKSSNERMYIKMTTGNGIPSTTGQWYSTDTVSWGEDEWCSWNFYVVTWDTINAPKLYINGIELSLVQQVFTGSVQDVDSVYVALSPSTVGMFVDTFSVYNINVSASFISDMYDAWSPPSAFSFYVAGLCTDNLAINTSVTVTDNTTVFTNPSNLGNATDWVFIYQIANGDDNGTFYVGYTVYDMVGNEGTGWFLFYYDIVGPTATIDDDPDLLALVNNYHDDQTVNVTVTSITDGDGSGVNATHFIRWKLDAGSWGDWNSTVQMNFTLSEGSHIIHYQLKDNVSSIGGQYNITVYVDLTDPTIDDLEYDNPTYDPNYYRSTAGSGYADYNVTWTESYIYNISVNMTEFSYIETNSTPSGGVTDFTNLQVASRNPAIARYYNLTITIFDNSGRSATYTTTGVQTLYIDNYAPTMTFVLDQHPDALASNYWKLLIVNGTVSGIDDNGNSSGIPTLAYSYRVEGSGWGTWESDTTNQFTGVNQENVTIYARVRDNVGNERIYTTWVIVDATFPVLGWVTLNETWAPNWFDQAVSTAAGVTITWTELYPHNITMFVSPHLTHTNDTSPDPSVANYSSLTITITGASDGTYIITATIWDKAGNNDTTIMGLAAINLRSGMTGETIENWFYFYFFRSDGLGLDWRDFNVSYTIDEEYKETTEERIRGALFAQKYLNITSSIRFIVRNYFGDVVQNQSYSLPASLDLYITLPVYTFKVANLYDEVMNMTIERPNTSPTTFVEQIMPYEIFRWDMYAAVYNITVYIHETSTIALDDDGNALNDYQINMTITDYALFVDAPLTFREFSMIISDIWQFNIITNKDHKSLQPTIYIYMNDSLQSGAGFSPGTIVLSRPTYGFYNLTVYSNWTTYTFTYQRWITVESNAEITNFVISGLEETSEEIYISWNTNKGNGILRIYDNDSLVQTNGLEGIALLIKSSTIGLHQIQFNVSVESRVFTHYGNYTIADWTVVVTIRIYDDASPWVSIRDTHTVDVTVTRSDESGFNGYVYINGTDVTVAVIAGVGSFSVISTEVVRKRWVVSSVQDLSAQSRDFIANDLLVTFDTLIGTLTMVSTPPFYTSSIITFNVYFNSSYDETGIDNFRFRVLLNDKDQFDETGYTFSFSGLPPNTYTVTLASIENTDNYVEDGSSGGRTFTVEKEPTPLQREAEEFPFLAALMGIIGLGAVVAVWQVYTRRGKGKITDKQLRDEFKLAEKEYNSAGEED